MSIKRSRIEVNTTKKSNLFQPLNQYPLIPNPIIFNNASVIKILVKTKFI